MLLKYILFLFLNFNFVFNYNQPKVRLEIAPHQSKVNTPERQPFLLTCSGAGQEPTFFDHLKWFDPQKQEISNKNDYHFKNYDLREKKGSILLSFKEPSEALSGNYTCKGLFQNVVELSKSIEVNFYQDITWEDCPSSQALIKGKKNSLIRCKITAKPSADVTWSKDGKELASNKFLRNNNGLTVNGVIDESLEGKYDIEAHVSETGAIKYTSIMVNIHTEPEILELKPFFEVVEDETANLYCKAFGIPSVRYYWFDSNRRNLSTIGGYIVNTDNGDLIINKVNKEEVKGEFTCLVENSAGRSSKSTKIQVLSKPKILFFTNVSAVEDMNGFIECSAVGNPVPSLSIRKDGELSSITSGGNYMVEEIKMSEYESKIILKILKTQRSDDGLYYCIATNKIEKTDLVGHLQVEYKPDLRKTVKNVKTWGDRQVNLTCIVNSIPNATVSWYFLNNLLSSNNYYTIVNEDNLSNFKHTYQGINNLIINPKGATSVIYGDYTCRAENKHGYNYTTINLSQAYRPSIQEDPDLTNDSPTSILIKFNNNNFFNGGLPIKKLKVKYRERTQSENMAKIKEFPFDNDYILNGLLPRNFYYLSFSVENDVGSSDWTRDFEKIMPKESVPDCPKFTYDINSNCNPNLKPIESDFYDRFDVKWLQPNDNGRSIEIYSLKYYPVERELSGWNRIESYKEIFSSNNDQLIQRITSLRPNTTYQVELRAKNSEGYSAPSMLVFKTSFSNSAGAQSFQEQITKAFTDFYSMIIIIGIFLIITLFILDVILYVRYDFGFLFCLCHGCSSNNTRNGKKIKNSHSLNTGYAYHRPSNDIDHFIDKTARKEFQAELEYRLRMPKHSAV